MGILKKTVFITTILTAIASFAKHDGEYLHNLNSEFQTPHEDWAKPLEKPPKALVICQPGYDSTSIVELMRRMDVKCDSFMAMGWDKVGADDIYNGAVAGTGQTEKENELLGLLKKDYDVIVLANYRISSLPRESLLLISQMIAGRGASLVITGGESHLDPFRKDFCNLPCPEGQTGIMAMIDKSALSAGAFSEDPKKPADRIPVRTYRFGKGKIAVMCYDKGALGLFPKQPFSREWLARTECDSVLLQRTLLWAVGHEPSATASCIQNIKAGTGGFIQDMLALNGLAFRISGNGGVNAEASLRLRDQDSRVLWSDNVRFRIEKDGVLISARPPLLAPGDYFLDLIIRKDKFVDNIGEFMVKVESPLGETTLNTDKDSYREKENVKYELATALPAGEKTELRVRIIDTMRGEIWQDFTRQVSSGRKFTGSFIPSHVPSLSAYLDCELSSGGRIISKSSKLLYFPKDGLPTYFSYVWDGINEQLPATAELLGAAAGFDAVLSSDPKACPQKLGIGIVQYCAHISFGFDEKTGCSKWALMWNLFKPGEKAEEIYGNDQTFYNPKVRERVEAPFREWVRNYCRYGVQVYNLGDENNFSYEAGFSPSDLPAFRSFEKARYGSIEKLNEIWGSAYQSFDQVEHLRMKEALERKNYAGWMDHRAFVENTYADIHRFYSKIIKEYDPKAIVGAEGSNSGDLENTIRDLEFWGPYSDPLGNELVRSLGGSKLRSLWWGGYAGSHGGRNAFPFMLWTPLLTGAVNANSWFAGNTCSEGLTASGLGFAKYFKTLLPHLDALKGGIAQLLISTPLKNDGIAILWSHESDSASLIGTQFQNPKDSIGTLMQVCYAKGLQFKFLTPSMIAKGELKDYKMLFLFGAASISDKTAESIRTFCGNGGVVVADVNPGVMDEFCRLRQESVIGTLFGVQGIKALKTPTPRKIEINRELSGRKLALTADRVLSSPESDVMAVNTFGKGAAVLLNFGLGAAEQSASSSTPFDKFILDLLSVADVKPAASVEGVNPARTVLRVRSAKDFDVVGLVDSDSADLAKKALLKWGRKRHVYEADKGYLGELDQWETAMSTPFRIFCLFNAEQKPPEIKLSSENAEPGIPLSLNLANFAEGAVLRLELSDPYGKLTSPHPEVIVMDGKRKTHDLWFAYNWKPGIYKIVLTDVRTSLKSEKNVSVK